MQYVEENTDFEHFLQAISLDSHALMLEHVCHAEEGFGRTTHRLLGLSGQPRDSLEYLKSIDLVENGKPIAETNTPTFTWILSELGEKIKPYVVEGIKSRDNLSYEQIFTQPHSKGVPPVYTVAEMLLRLYEVDVPMSTLEKEVREITINGNSPSQSAYRRHKQRLIELGLLRQDEFSPNDRRLTWKKEYIGNTPKGPYDTVDRVAELMLDGGYFTKQEIADKLGIGTSTVQRALGHLKSYYRIAKPSEYNNIGLTDLGLAITEPIMKAHEGLMKSTQSD
ncbi:hypothetical protein HN789_01065 [archaeon]|jgi:hypothetical protein|nr:hypothetical protein [archaeon]MBT4022120.1 hypothetical protein [archaeon]MBT6773004.1 hypothetical protein [archaeon]MBT7439810.1 hypothetical protein [archaeon]